MLPANARPLIFPARMVYNARIKTDLGCAECR